MKTHTPASDDERLTTRSEHPGRVRVLYVIGSLPLGGAESQVVTLASALNTQHYELHVCCLRGEGVQACTLRDRGIPVVSLHMRLRHLPVGVYRLYRLIKELRPRILHTHLYEADLWGKLAGRLAGVPVIVSTLHGMPLWHKPYDLPVERFANRFPDKLIAVSDEIRQCYLDRQAAPPEKITTIPTAVDTARFRETDSRERTRAQLGIDASSPLIGIVARLVREKRVDIFLEAARLVREVVPEARFLVIGDGPLRSELTERAAALGLEPQSLVFLGSRQDIPVLLSALDLFVLSSETEGLPVSMLEAMAASLPIVVPCVGAIPHVILDHQNGLLVPPHDPGALAQAMLLLVQDAALRASIAEHACRTVEDRFSAPVITRQISELYDGLLDMKEGSHVG